MFSPFIAVLGTLVILVGISQAGNLDNSNLAPLSIVYTVYPYYNSGALLGIWKGEKVINDVTTLARQSEEPEARNGAYTGVQDVTSGSNDRESSRNDSEESADNEGNSEITYWPPVQRGAAPKLRIIRPADLRPSNLKSDV